METPISQFYELLQVSFDTHTFHKLTLSKPASNSSNKNLKNVYIRLIQLKSRPTLQLTYRYATRDEFKNYSIEEGLIMLALHIETDFLNADLFTTTHEISLLGRKKITKKNNQKSKSDDDAPPSVGATPQPPTPTLEVHDRPKKRFIAPETPFLHDLEITTSEGKVVL